MRKKNCDIKSGQRKRYRVHLDIIIEGSVMISHDRAAFEHFLGAIEI